MPANVVRTVRIHNSVCSLSSLINWGVFQIARCCRSPHETLHYRTAGFRRYWVTWICVNLSVAFFYIRPILPRTPVWRVSRFLLTARTLCWWTRRNLQGLGEMSVLAAIQLLRGVPGDTFFFLSPIPVFLPLQLGRRLANLSPWCFHGCTVCPLMFSYLCFCSPWLISVKFSFFRASSMGCMPC